MTSPHVGLVIALAAVLVQAPRLVLALLAADRLPVAASTERTLLIVAGVGTALVLTGGNLYLAHTVAQVKVWRLTLAAAWLAALAASGGLVIPYIVAGLTARTVPQVLGAGQIGWSWAFLAAVAHELTAAGCVLASAAWTYAPAGNKAGPASVPCRAGCGRTFVSQQAEIAHLRHCSRRRTGGTEPKEPR
jgi:MFS family permease